MLTRRKKTQKPLLKSGYIHFLEEYRAETKKFTNNFDGEVNVFLPDRTKIRVGFYKNEKIEKLKERIQELTSIDTNRCYFICNDGIITKESNLDNYNIKPESNLILQEFDIRKQRDRKRNEEWIRRCERKNIKENTSLPSLLLSSRKSTPYQRSIKERSSLNSFYALQ